MFGLRWSLQSDRMWLKRGEYGYWYPATYWYGRKLPVRADLIRERDEALAKLQTEEAANLWLSRAVGEWCARGCARAEKARREVGSSAVPDYQVRYFGEHWDVPLLEDAVPAPLPTEPCIFCGESFEPGDQGRYYVNGTAAHRECDLRSILGGINHLKGTCRCHGGSDLPDPAGISPREAARLVLDWVREAGGAP